MKHNNTLNGRRKLVKAVATAVAIMSAPVTYAACTGSVSAANSTTATIFCTGAGSDINNTGSIDSSALTQAPAANSTNALIEFQGLGKTLTNSGTINNGLQKNNATTSTLTRFAVSMGTATIDTNAFSNASSATTGLTAGAATVKIGTLPTSTTATSVIGQTLILGRYDAVNKDFFTGESRTITAYDAATGIATLDSAITANFAANGDAAIPYGFTVVSGSGTNTITNTATGVISAGIGATEINANVAAGASASSTSTVRAIETTIKGDYIVNNAGSITASHAGVGAVQAVDGGGTANTLTITNTGTLSINRISSITLTTNSATSQKGTIITSGGTLLSAQNIGAASTVYSQEELGTITTNNSGTIRAKGDLVAGFYMRAGEQIIVNDGTIEAYKSGADSVANRSIAIASVSDTGQIRTLDLTNNGTITGDILAVNSNAFRWYTLSNFNATGGADPSHTNLDNRLGINNNWGQLDSVITNAGTITGDLYYSNGKHELINESDATLTGNIDLDQRDTTCNNTTGCAQSTALGENTKSITATNGVVVGSKDFTFENAGTFAGNITIRTASSTVLGGSAPVASSVTLIPTVSGSGAGSTLEAPSHHIEGMGDVLTIDATAGAGTVTVAPKSLVTVHKGEYFLVADALTLTGGATTPLVSNANTKLVNWSIGTNTSGNLVIGVDSVNSAATVTGVSKESADAIDALMTSTTNIGGALQSPTLTSAEIEKAGQQLRPEANNASMQASFATVDRVSSVIGTRQDEVRVASNGNSGISTGEAAQGRGFWMQGFGFKGDQDKRGNIDGYSASTGGFAFGGDALVGNGDFRIGAAVSYASTGVDGEGANAANRTDIDSYQGTLYGSWNAGAWYVDASLGYARHQYDTKRLVTVGLVTDTVTGSHDGNQYLVKIGGGYPMQWGKVIFTPLASATYVHLDQDGYTERGTAGAALVVNDTQTDSFRTGLGAKIKLPLSEGTIKTSVEARAIWNHEFGDNSQDITARFAAGGSSFTTNGVALKRDSANLGLGLNMASVNGQTLSVNYDADVKSDYAGHTASVQFRYDF